MENIFQNAEALFNNLQKFLKTETVVGTPIKIEETTIIPLITVTFGCGSGSGNKADSTIKELGITGEGLGAGAKISPTAIIVVRSDEVSLLPVKDKVSTGSLLDMVPEIVSKLNLGKGSRKEEDEVKKADA